METTTVHWEIRTLIRLGSEIVVGSHLLKGTENEVMAAWVNAGYERSNIEDVQQHFAMFKVTRERVDDPNANAKAIKKHKDEMAEWDKKHGKIDATQLFHMAREQLAEDDIDRNGDDLHIKRSEASKALIRRYKSQDHIALFRNTDNQMWYEVLGAWKEEGGNVHGI